MIACIVLSSEYVLKIANSEDETCHFNIGQARDACLCLSIATRHLNLYASEQKLVRRKNTTTLPFLGSHFLTFWISPDFFVAFTSQCSRIQVYSHADKVLRDLGHVSLNLHKKYLICKRKPFIIVPLLLRV